MKFGSSLVSLAVLAGAALALDTARFTAISAKDGKSTVECWELTQPVGKTAGLSIVGMGEATGSTYLEAPDDIEFKQGPYNPARPQFFVILEGNATITFPESEEVLRVRSQHLYIAADTADVSTAGHVTVVSKGARMIQLPFANGVPAHTATPGECGDKPHSPRDEL